MARLRASFVTFAAVCAIGLHLIVLPALYFGVGLVIRKSHEQLFVQHARTFTRVLADEFEVGSGLDSEARTGDLLDLAVIHGEAQFAEISGGDHSFRSQLGTPSIKWPRRTDMGYKQGDGIYIVVLPVMHSGRNYELRIGFDEQPTEASIRLALNGMLRLLAGYAVVTIGIAIFLTQWLSRPIKRLREVSRAIASGDYAQALRLKTGVRELHDLAVDLEAMRSELVGVTQLLQQEIREKEFAEMRRDALEKQLRHRQRLETVGTLAGGIAHEFNNVLLPIMLFTDAALADLPADSTSRTDLERVLASARRAKNVVQKILTFSHVLGDTELTSIDMRAVVSEALNIFLALAPAGIEINADVGENIPPVAGDATLALDLVMNLCTNAVRAMQGMAGVLTVGLRYLERGHGAASSDALVEFWVQDTGHGMDAATVERIFEPFFTTRPVGEGTGLGLAVVHGIVKSFKAKIAVDSKPGGGTTIRIYFPVTQSHALAS